MKLTQPDLKIKCKYAHLKTLYDYLREIIEHHEEYLISFVFNKSVRRLYRHTLSTLCEKVAKFMFNHINEQNKLFTLKFTDAERMVFFEVTKYYPLPMDINFIEYEIKNGLLS